MKSHSFNMILKGIMNKSILYKYNRPGNGTYSRALAAPSAIFMRTFQESDLLVASSS